MDTTSTFALPDSLRIILDQTSTEKDIIIWLSLSIAALAVFVGPILQYIIGKKQILAQTQIARDQIHSNVLSNNRQQWINSLRSEIAEFVSLVLTLATKSVDHGPEVLSNFMQKIVLCRAKITLMINPSEDDNKELDTKMGEVIELALNLVVNYQEDGAEKMRSLASQIISISQTILKREWDRAKKLE